MLRLLRVVVLILGLTVLLIWTGWFLFCRHVSMQVTEQVSIQLGTSSEIDRVIANGRQLNPAEIEAIPKLMQTIEIDFGYLDQPDTGFYLVSADTFESLDKHWLPGLTSYKNQFVIHAPSGIVYYAGYPLSALTQINSLLTYKAQPGAIPDSNPYIGWAPWATGLPYADIQPTLAFALVR